MSPPSGRPVARPSSAALIGTAVSLLVTGAWGLHVTLLLSTQTTLAWWTPLAVLLQTFLHTGLFIVAHDAMHGSVAPGWPRINRGIGQLTLLLYALFPLKALQQAHKVHHRAPASPDDPDHTGGHPLNYARWYLRFMLQYLRWYQIVGLATVFNVLNHLAGVPTLILLVYWVGPSLLSTFQLFTFGTYLPHRVPEGGHTDHHAARSSNWSPWLSLLTCYHFGYHWAHHEYPSVPWWRLPKFHRMHAQ
ncbi:MAG: fatty acid desaturase [Myxococcota bacterium]